MDEVQQNKDFKVIKKSDGSNYTVRTYRNRFFYPREWTVFFDALKTKQKITFNFLIQTGGRINEIRNIKVGDVDLTNHRIILRITKVKAKKGEKNPKPRVIPISSQFCRYIKNLIDKKKLINEDFFPILSTPAANIAMKKALIKAGIKDPYNFSVHNVRKTTEIFLLCLGVDTMPLLAHIGHDIKTAMASYVSPDALSYDEKRIIRDILGDIYQKQF